MRSFQMPVWSGELMDVRLGRDTDTTVMDWADATEWVERYAWFDMFVTAGS